MGSTKILIDWAAVGQIISRAKDSTPRKGTNFSKFEIQD
jgi:hypothetical protein